MAMALPALAWLGSQPAAAQPAPACGAMDVAFVVDDTGSMTGSLASVSSELATLIPLINAASGGVYRLATVTFKDGITVRDVFSAGNGAAAAATLASLVASGGGNEPEASDEAMDTVVNARTKAVADAVLPTINAPGTNQNANFAPDWGGPGVLKIAILVTDARPGGFDSAYSVGFDDAHAHAVALAAAAKGIKISAIHVPSGTFDATIAPIMTDYATTSGGVYVLTGALGTGTGAAITDIISHCGTHEVDWLTGGGQLASGNGSATKRLSFGGNVGALADGTLVGQWETNFHNVSTASLVKGKFHSTAITALTSSNDGGAGPGQPPASSNVVTFTATGWLQNGPTKTAGYTLSVCAADRGEPGKSDSLRVVLTAPDGVTVVYDSVTDFSSDATAGACGTTSLRAGNLQIHAGPRS